MELILIQLVCGLLAFIGGSGVTYFAVKKRVKRGLKQFIDDAGDMSWRKETT